MKYIVTLNGKNYEVDVEESEAVLTSVTDSAPVQAAAPAPQVSTPAASTAPVSVEGGTKATAPMPGTILAVKVSVGSSVKAGDVLVVLEAMKMENDIVAPCDGVVKQLLVQKSSTVNTDDVIAVIGG